jgi:hypothetical protein
LSLFFDLQTLERQFDLDRQVCVHIQFEIFGNLG